MRTKSSITFVFLLLIFFISNCTVHKSTMLGSRSNGKCTYQSIAFGVSEKKQIFGIGGNSTDAMLFEAKRNLYQAFPLQKGEFYDNFVIDYKTTYYPFVKNNMVTVTADIILEDYCEKGQLFSENYTLSLNAGRITTIDNINISDSVVYMQKGAIKKGIVINFQNNDAVVLVHNRSGNQVFEKVPVKKLFTIGNEEIEDITGYEAGQVLEITSGSSKDGATEVKAVIGLRNDKVLISSSYKNKTVYSIIPLDKIKANE